MCFGPNNSDSMNLPGLFPLRFDGNCIFATQPLFQCEDDGSDDEPLVVELDIADELSDEMDDGSGDDSMITAIDLPMLMNVISLSQLLHTQLIYLLLLMLISSKQMMLRLVPFRQVFLKMLT